MSTSNITRRVSKNFVSRKVAETFRSNISAKYPNNRYETRVESGTGRFYVVFFCPGPKVVEVPFPSRMKNLAT